jgi:hypothetical protein
MVVFTTPLTERFVLSPPREETEETMKLDGFVLCDFCTGVIFPDEGTPVHLQVGEKKFTFHYHNRNATDCLKQKIEQLRQQFAAQKN